MTLFRKFFYRKPPERLVEVSERVYVLDCCFSTDFIGDDTYKDHVESAVTKMRDHWPDASFAVFSFLPGENRSQIADLLSEHNIKVMEYHTQHGNRSLLAFEMVHHFLIASESWLDLKESNVLLLHCERSYWPVLAFLLAALLIYKKHCVGEQKTLDMVYNYAPPELLQLVSEINPVPSQLRYLQYVSERNLYSEWPPLVRSLILHCIVLRGVPSMDHAKGSFRPIFRIYGLNPVVEADQIPKMMYSSPKGSDTILYYKADCDPTKIDINCQIKGDVMIECITLDEDRQLEETIFRIMFNTSFVKSHMLVLSWDEVDTPWNVLDHFSRDFKAEILFSEVGSSDIQNHFPKDLKDGVQRKMLSRQDNFGRELEGWSETSVLNAQKMKTYPEEPLTALSRPVESKILSHRIHTVSSSHSFQESLLRYPNGHSPLGITALLQDTSSNTKFASNMVTISPKSSLSPCSVLLRSSICNLSAPRDSVSPQKLDSDTHSKMSSSLTSNDSVHHPPPQPVLSKPAKSMQSVNSVSDSKDTLESSPSVPLLAASSSSHSPSCSTDSASSITTTPPFLKVASSSSQISSAKSEEKRENATESQPSNASGSISCHLPEKSCETVTRPPQPPQPPPSCPPKPPLARIPPPPPGAKPPLAKSPPPPPGAKFRLPSSVPEAKPKKSSLKPYHWLKLTKASKGSLWAEIQKPEEAAEAPEFDRSELESLFPATVQHGGTKCNLKGKSVKVNLIDSKRAYNCEIMLTKIKIPLPDIMSSVLSFDDSTLDADQVDRMIKFCPSEEEMVLLKNYSGDKENLGKCEQMMKVPRADSKLKVFSFRIQFDSVVSDLRGVLNLVNSACEEVRNSIKLKRVMISILSLGNVLNHGTARGSAIGFRLDSLLKLSDTRARNNKMTLLHYLCKVLAEKLPELIDFPKELMSLEAVTKIQLKNVAVEMLTFSKKLKIASQELQELENDGPVSENFCKMLRAFIDSAKAEEISLESLFVEAGKNADELRRYFNEFPDGFSFEQVVTTLLNFVRMFTKAHEDNCMQLELEKTRGKKDVVYEKVKPGEFDKDNSRRTNVCK